MWVHTLAGMLAQPWARWLAGIGLVVLTINLFILNLRRTAERTGRAAERLDQLERTHAIHHDMLDAAARRPRGRDDLLDRLRGVGFDAPPSTCPPVVAYSRAEQAKVCSIPRIGPVTAGAVAAFAPDLNTFDSGRNFAA